MRNSKIIIVTSTISNKTAVTLRFIKYMSQNYVGDMSLGDNSRAVSLAGRNTLNETKSQYHFANEINSVKEKHQLSNFTIKLHLGSFRS